MSSEIARVAFVIPSLALGGSERAIVELADTFAASGIDVEVWLSSSAKVEVQTQLRVRALSSAGRRKFLLPSVIARALAVAVEVRRFRPDAVVSFLESSNIPCLLSAYLTPCRFVVSVRGNPARFNWFYRLCARWLYPAAHAVVTPSGEVALQLARQFSLGNCVAIPNSVRFTEVSCQAPLEKRRFPLVAVGRLVPGKRVDEVIAVARQLCGGWPLVIVGDGPERSKLEAIVRSSAADVRFLGAQSGEGVREAIVGASALVSMSTSECWPNVIAESLALGTPVIARDCDFGPREMIQDGINGFLIDAPEDVVRRSEIARVLGSDDAYRSMCGAAARSVEKWGRATIGAQWRALVAADPSSVAAIGG